MKKLSKKAWKEYFDDEWNWLVDREIPEHGLRITHLTNTEVYALERWHVPFDFVREMGVKPSWIRQFCYVRQYDENGNCYINQMNKTGIIEMLWLEQEGKQ